MFYHSDMTFWSLLIELRCLAPVIAQGRGIAQVDVWLLDMGTKTTKKWGQNGHFSDVSRPELAPAMECLHPEATISPGWTDTFKIKQPARLGKLPLHQMASPINSHAGEGLRGAGNWRNKKKNAEKKKKSKVEAPPN